MFEALVCLFVASQLGNECSNFNVVFFVKKLIFLRWFLSYVWQKSMPPYPCLNGIHQLCLYTVWFNSKHLDSTQDKIHQVFLINSEINLSSIYSYSLTHLTCSIFISTTPSEEWSVPTNLACVTASAISSTVAGTVGCVGSVMVKNSYTHKQHVHSDGWIKAMKEMYVLVMRYGSIMA